MPRPGLCVLVTRPQPQADQWVGQLQRLGLAAAALPLLGIAPPASPAAVHRAWHWLARKALPAPESPAQPAPAGGVQPARVDEAAAKMADSPAGRVQPARVISLVMFVSPNAAERFFALRPAGQPWPDGVIAGGTGPGTRRALRQAGVPESLLCTPPEPDGPFDSEALWLALRGRADWPSGAAPKSALIVRGEGGRDWLADTLRQHGATVHFVEAYRRTMPVLDAAGQALLQQAVAQPAGHVWLFSSSEAVACLGTLAPQVSPHPAWGVARALATHPRIADAARRLGFGTVQTVAPLPDAVFCALRDAALSGGLAGELAAGRVDTIR